MGWQELRDLRDIQRRESLEDVGEVFLGVDAASPATDDQRVDDRAAPTGVGVPNEEPATATDGGTTDRVFDEIMPTAGLCRVEWWDFGSSSENSDSGDGARGIIWPSGDERGFVTNGGRPESPPRFLRKSRERRLQWRSAARFRLPQNLRIMPRPQRPDPSVQTENARYWSATRHNPAVGITGPRT